VNVQRITDYGSADQLFESNLTFSVVCVFTRRLMSGAFTIDSSTPTMKRNLNEYPICFINNLYIPNSSSFLFCPSLFYNLHIHISLKDSLSIPTLMR
jgi:hypothetical protein